MRRGLVLLVVLASAAAAPVGAAEAKLVYRTRGYAGLTKAPKRPPARPHDVVVGAGTWPSVIVDQAGFAHAVWAERRFGAAQPDVLRYCRIPRGGRACDVSHALVPPAATRYSGDSGGPKIVQIGNQLAVLTARYPETRAHPDGTTTSTTVWEWISPDGGRTFTGPAQLGRQAINGDAIGWGGDIPSITTITDTVTGGTFAQTSRAGAFVSEPANLATGPDQAYAGSLAVAAGRPIAAYAGLDGTSYVRRWSGGGDPNDAATWTPPLVLPDSEETELGSGPLGTFLQTRRRSTGRTEVRQVDLGTGRFGRPSVTGPGGNYRDFTQDPGGLLHSTWTQQDIDGVHVIERTSSDGRRWSNPERLGTTKTSGFAEKSVAAASDGGGWVIWAEPIPGQENGPIHATSIGTLARAPGRGAGNIDASGRTPPGSGWQPGISFECQRIAVGAITVLTRAGCFLRDPRDPTGSSGVTAGPVRLNGLDIVPDPGARIVIDPKRVHIDSIGEVTVELRGAGTPIKLFHGELHVDAGAGASGARAASAAAGTRLFSFDTAKYAAILKGFPIRGKIDVYLEKDAVRIPVSLGLPPALADVRGQAVLKASNDRGLHLDSLDVHVGNVFVGPLLVERLDVSWSAEDVWEGNGKIRFPAGGALGIRTVRFEGGRFKRGGIEVEPPPPGIAIAPFTYLIQLGGDLALFPPKTNIGADATIGAGASFQGVAPVSVKGRFDLTIDPKLKVQLSGEGRLFVLKLADAFLRYEADGYATFGGNAGLDLKVASLLGKLDGFVDARTGAFGASGEVRLCPLALKAGPFSFPCVREDAAINNRGIAVCATVSFPDPPVGDVSGGLELPWDALDGLALVNPTLAAVTIASHLQIPCSTGAYRSPPRPARAAATGVPIRVGRGTPTATAVLFGRDRPPRVTVSGPSPRFYTVTSEPARATWVVLRSPRAGTYTVRTDDAVNKVLIGTGYRPLRVSARLRGRGRVRTLRYRLRDAGAGQRVTFVEQGAFGSHLIGGARGTRGAVRFRIADARGGRRTVWALVGRGGFVSRRIRVARFRAPGPSRPGRVRGLRLRRRGGTVRVSWGRATGAARYAVAYADSGGRDVLRIVRGRRLFIRGVPREARARVSVRGRSRAGRLGRARARTLRAARRAPVVYGRR